MFALMLENVVFWFISRTRKISKLLDRLKIMGML